MLSFLKRAALPKGLVGRRLSELGYDLAVLSRQVQRAVTQALRDALAQLARDVVDRVFG